MLNGTIYITDNLDIVKNTPINNISKIISLDEDSALGNYKEVIGGTCLLPPIEAKIAEADGNEQMYDNIYSNHLLLPYQQQFVAALIAFLYRGGNLLLYLPEYGYNHTTEKLVFHIFKLYGIHIGIIGNSNYQIANCYYDNKCIPIWLNLIYMANVLSPYEYLYLYPENAPLNNEQVMMLLIEQINPYAETIIGKRNYILNFHKLIHKNQKVRPAIHEVN